MDFELIEHHYTHCASYGQYEVYVDPKTGAGWFRHFAHPRDCGLLWLRAGKLQATSAQYLPHEVAQGLRLAGFAVAR